MSEHLHITTCALYSYTFESFIGTDAINCMCHTVFTVCPHANRNRNVLTQTFHVQGHTRRRSVITISQKCHMPTVENTSQLCPGFVMLEDEGVHGWSCDWIIEPLFSSGRIQFVIHLLACVVNLPINLQFNLFFFLFFLQSHGARGRPGACAV